MKQKINNLNIKHVGAACHAAQGITLIALIITIIVMLILAGVVLNLTIGERGIFNTAKMSGEEYEKAQIKEEIELAITDIQAEELAKGNIVTLQTLANGQLVSKLQDITTELGDNEITGEYKDYEYTIDSNFKVTIGEKVTGIKFNYILNPSGYTNGDVILSIEASSTNGTITNIEHPNTITKNADGTYTITQNGSYEFTISDSTGNTKTKEIKIQNIDKIKPIEFTPVVSKTTSTKITIEANAKDNEGGSGIGKYEYYINNSKDGETTENKYTFEKLDRNTTYTIYVIAYDKAQNPKQSSTITVTTSNGDYPTLTLNGVTVPEDGLAGDALTGETYDKNYSTYKTLNPGELWLKIDPSCWEKYITLYCNCDATGYGYINFRGVDKTTVISKGYIRTYTGENNITELNVRSIQIPKETYWICFSSGTGASDVHFNIYEVWLSNENLTGKSVPNAPMIKLESGNEKVTLEYPILTKNGMVTCYTQIVDGDNVTLEIISKEEKATDYYSLDGGNSWTKYTDKISIVYPGEEKLLAKSVNDGFQSKTSVTTLKDNKYYYYDSNSLPTAEDALDPAAYDGNYSTYYDPSSTKKKFYFGDDIDIYQVCFKIDSDARGVAVEAINTSGYIAVPNEGKFISDGIFHCTYYGKNSKGWQGFFAYPGVKLYEIYYDGNIE